MHTQSSHIRTAKNSRFFCTGIIFIMLSETPSKAEYVTYKLHSAVITQLLPHSIPQTHATFYTEWYSDTRHEM